MNFEPLIHTPLPVQIHVATVVPAFFIGTYQIFFSRKGERFHRALGYTYLALMTVTAIAALFVHQIMPRSPFFGLSPIHLFVPLTLFGFVGALRGVWTHKVGLHLRPWLGLYMC